jgi:hypothetical protein
MITAEKVKGYETLGVNTQMFEQFFQNFLNAWGSEARATIKPISVGLRRDKANGPYLKFVYRIYGYKEWAHVKSPTTWY